MEEADLLDAINEGLKRKYTYGQVFSSEVDLKILKKIDSWRIRMKLPPLFRT